MWWCYTNQQSLNCCITFFHGCLNHVLFCFVWVKKYEDTIVAFLLFYYRKAWRIITALCFLVLYIDQFKSAHYKFMAGK